MHNATASYFCPWYQQHLDRGFFYVWANKIGTRTLPGGEPCVAGNYWPCWTGTMTFPHGGMLVLSALASFQVCRACEFCRGGPFSLATLLVSPSHTLCLDPGRRGCGKQGNFAQRFTRITFTRAAMGSWLEKGTWKKWWRERKKCSLLRISLAHFSSLRITSRSREQTTLLRDEGASGKHAACRCCLLYTSPSPRDQRGSRMPSSA